MQRPIQNWSFATADAARTAAFPLLSDPAAAQSVEVTEPELAASDSSWLRSWLEEGVR
jgi:hypothetical protein